METFIYTGEDKDGNKVEKTVEAADRYAVYDIAREAGHVVNTVKKAGEHSLRKWFDVKQIERLTSRISGDDLVLMTRNLGAMLTAGLPLTRALSVIQRQSSNPKLSAVAIDVRERIEKGDQFYDALEAHPKVFSRLYISMVHAGEESGNLADTLQILGTQMERTANLKKKIKGAMIYPAIVMTIMVIIAILMMIYVMPSITKTFRKLDVDLPITTRVLIGTSDFMVAHTILVIVGLIAAVVGFMYALRTRIGKKIFHWIILRLPIIGTMVKETNAARTARTLSSLLGSGVDVINSIKITEDVVQNVYYKPILAEAATSVEKGNPLSETFSKHEKLYPVFVGEMVLVGEETGQIGQMLDQLATYYENAVERKTKDLSTIIEPLLMVVIGGTVGFFALAMIAPIYSISDSIG